MLINPVLFFSLDTFSVQNNICEQCKVVWQINGIILIGQLSILVGQFNFSHQLCRSVYSPAKTLFAFLSISVLHFKNGRISNFPTFSAACILRICWSRSLYDVALHERTISSSHSCKLGLLRVRACAVYVTRVSIVCARDRRTGRKTLLTRSLRSFASSFLASRSVIPRLKLCFQRSVNMTDRCNGHLKTLLGNCPMTDSYFVHCTL